jgi:hypothetical protein
MDRNLLPFVTLVLNGDKSSALTSVCNLSDTRFLCVSAVNCQQQYRKQSGWQKGTQHSMQEYVEPSHSVCEL